MAKTELYLLQKLQEHRITSGKLVMPRLHAISLCTCMHTYLYANVCAVFFLFND